MNSKDVAVRGLRRACTVFLQDLEALPEEAFATKFGPKVRTVADIVYEVNVVNDHLCKVMRGEDAGPWPFEGWVYAPEDFQSKETVVEAFRKSSESAIADAESFTDAQFEEPMQTEGGEPTSRFERFRFLTVHLWYHSGQLNFIQTLLGDDGWHWS
ncbi:MAG: DinB family protein [Fimbriimonadales bacterium]